MLEPVRQGIDRRSFVQSLMLPAALSVAGVSADSVAQAAQQGAAPAGRRQINSQDTQTTGSVVSKSQAA